MAWLFRVSKVRAEFDEIIESPRPGNYLKVAPAAATIEPVVRQRCQRNSPNRSANRANRGKPRGPKIAASR
jgi:hypothetical protein